MFRLNTLDFDESLVFTGEGAKKNNYLINLFLEHEKEEKSKGFKNRRFCKCNPENGKWLLGDGNFSLIDQ